MVRVDDRLLFASEVVFIVVYLLKSEIYLLKNWKFFFSLSERKRDLLDILRELQVQSLWKFLIFHSHK